MDKKNTPLQETHFRSKNKNRLNVKEYKKIFHENGNKQKSGEAILIPDKIDFRTKAITRDKERSSNSTAGYLSKDSKTLI